MKSSKAYFLASEALTKIFGQFAMIAYGSSDWLLYWLCCMEKMNSDPPCSTLGCTSTVTA